ncbi:MAG: tetratricopeptide repeat protein [Candidatus Zixiibacteriota bacterium]|nr:MAG: tetratricopeptide repeat protein [candidate division Zixibacteria bacterium]
MKSKSSRKNLFLWLIIGLGFALRLANVLAIGDDFYANFLSDASTYRVWASKITAGASYLGPAFPMGPLYPYFLALCLSIGFSFYLVLFLQAVFGAIVVLNIYIITKRIFDKDAGLIAAFMAAVYGPFVLYDGLLLSESPQLLLISSALLLIIPEKGKKNKPLYYFLSGILIGLTALGRGTILIFPFFLFLYWFSKFLSGRKKRSNRYLKQAVLIIIGTICGIFPATIHNISNGEFVPVSSNFGINFYIGNNPEATGSYNEPQGLNLSSDFTGRQIAEEESGRKLKSAEVSDFWFERAFNFIKENPLKFAAGLFKKAWLYIWNFDIPQAESIQIHHRFSPIFRILPNAYWFILIPGLIGIVMSARNESKCLLLMLLASSLTGVMVFFAIGRFKLIGSITLLVFAGSGIRWIYKSLREKDRQMPVPVVLIVIVSLLLLFLPRPVDRNSKIASAYDNVGISYFFKSKPEEAIKWYRRAVDIQPAHPGALNNIGGYFYTKQRPDSAIHYFHKSIESDSADDKPYQNLGRTFLNLGQVDSAYYYYQKARSLSPYGLDADRALKELEILTSDTTSQAPDLASFDMLFGLAERYAGQRQFDLAETYYLRALQLRPDDIRGLNNLGFTYQAQGKFDKALDMFNRVIELTGGSAIAYNNLASVYYRKGLIDSAEVLWEKALKLDPENAQIRKNLDYIRTNRNN